MMDFAKHTHSARAVEEIIREMEILAARGGGTLGVCGLGGTGKSTSCREAANRRSGDAVVFETDWYLEHATQFRRQLIASALASGDAAEIARWEDPSSWYNWQALLGGLDQLRLTGSLQIVDAWRQTTGEKDLVIDLRLPRSGAVILVDGIYLLHDPVRQVLDRVVLLEAELDSSSRRGQQRDVHRSALEYLQWKAKLAERFDCPYFGRLRNRADRIIAV